MDLKTCHKTKAQLLDYQNLRLICYDKITLIVITSIFFISYKCQALNNQGIIIGH